MTASAFTHGASQSQLCQYLFCLTKPRGIQCGFELLKLEHQKNILILSAFYNSLVRKKWKNQLNKKIRKKY
jgi:hypothetical protein